MDTDTDDIANALTQSIANDGQTPILANLPMAGFKHTNVAAATVATDYARFDQVQGAASTWEDAATGSANAIALTLSPGITAYVDGFKVRFRATAANTTAATLNVNAVGARALLDGDGNALTANRVIVGAVYEATYVSATNSFYLDGGGTATLTATQTLTNKTLTAPTVNTSLTMATGPINEAQGANIASAGTINLTTATGNLVDVTGTTTITAVTLAQGAERTVRFTGALTLTNGASLVLPGNANIVTAAGDVAVFRGYAAGVVRVVSYQTQAARTFLASGGAITGDVTITGNLQMNGRITGNLVSVASASTIDLTAVAGNLVDITGTTTIDGVTLGAGDWALCRIVTGPITFTHNTALLRVLGNADLTATAEDYLLFYGLTATITGMAMYSRRTSLPFYAEGGTVTGDLIMSGAAVEEAQGANIASAASINLETATGNLVDVTGTTTITAVTLSQGHERTVRFTGALQITPGASLILPGNANILTAAGDVAVFRGYAAGVVRMVNYQRLTGQAVQQNPIVLGAGSLSLAGDTSITLPDVDLVNGKPFRRLTLNINNMRCATDFTPFLRINGSSAASYAYYAGLGVLGVGFATTQADGQTGVCLHDENRLVDNLGTNPGQFQITLETPAGSQIKAGRFSSDLMTRDDASEAYSAGSWRFASVAAITSVNILLRATSGSSPTGATLAPTAGTYYWLAET